jgi:hypothetical protein
LFDQPHVVQKAEAVLAASGVSERCEVVAGSFFDTVPSGADAYLMRVVIHDWDDEEALAILKVCRRAMRTGAKLLLIERVVEPPNAGMPAKFGDLHMLVLPGGRERTFDEYSALCRKAGFETLRSVRAGPHFQIIECEPR